MPNLIAAVALVVRDYDEAIHFFTQVLRFTVEDTPLPSGKRWVTVRPCGGAAVCSVERGCVLGDDGT